MNTIHPLLLVLLALLPACRSPETPSSSAPPPSRPVESAPVPPPSPVPDPLIRAPEVSRESIFRPAFLTSEGRLEAGTGFVVSLPGRPTPVGVTALHLFGPAGGLAREVTSAELPAFVRAVTPADLGGKDDLVPGGRMLLLRRASHPTPSDDFSGDLAAFELPAEYAPYALRIAPQLPKAEERVWLIARLSSLSDTERLHAAKVVSASATALWYAFDDAEIALRGTSGAPVVNAAGEVVGVNLGAARKNGRRLAYANPGPSVLGQLQEASGIHHKTP